MTTVVEAEAMRTLVPLRTMSRLSCAPFKSSFACSQAISERWKSAAEIVPSSTRFLLRW